MRNIGPEWRNPAEGLLRVEALEARFRAEWGPRLEEDRHKKEEAELRKLRGRGRAALFAASVVALLLLAVALVLLLLFPLQVVAAVFVLAVLVPAALAPYGVWALRHIPDPLPDPSDLSGRWWATISALFSSVQRSGPALWARRYGDEGERVFVAT